MSQEARKALERSWRAKIAPPPPELMPEAGESWGSILDRVLALILLVVLSPVFLIVALVVKLESSKDPVFYLQERVGLNRRQVQPSRPGELRVERRHERREGRPFRIWKFRSMVSDAEAGTGPVWAQEDDPRITSIGRFLRKTRLDELPQLVNVLRGEMRLVGPRPERPFFVAQLAERVPGYRRRLHVPPGITGLAQVERDYDADLDDVKKKLRYDLYYIDHRKPAMDIKILLKTISVVLRRKGAR